MLPLQDINPTRRLPILTYLLIAINVLVFLWELSMPADQLDAMFGTLAVVPAQATMNPFSVETTMSILRGMFFHAGWAHLLGNMLYLWLFGDNVEDRLGHGLFFVFYILCGLGATFAQLAFSMGSSIPNLGASGAIAGVLGAYLIMFPKGSVNVLVGRVVTRMSALIVIGFWIVLQIFSGIGTLTASSQNEGGVAYMA